MTSDGADDAIQMLGGFGVRIDGRPVDPSHWRRRPAASLVKLLALSPDRRLHREQVIDVLWPDLAVAEAAPRLHKAVHFVRRALGGNDTVVTAGSSVQLLPGREPVVDVVDFESAATAGLDRDDVVARRRAIACYRGDLLPDDRYEPWTETRREHLAQLHRQLLRVEGRWAELVTLDPTDEGAHLGLINAAIERGDRVTALGQYERLALMLEQELGVEPGPESQAALVIARGLPLVLDDAPPLPPQQINFCHARDGVRLAYAVAGEGRPLVRAANWLTHLEYDWESSLWRHWLRELTSRFRLLRYDERGCGLSDWNTESFSMEAWIEDLESVVDAAGYDRFPLLGVSQGAAVAVEFASRHPERVSALVIYGGYVHGPVARARTDDARRVAELLPSLAELGWGTDEPSFRQVFTSRFMPGGSRAQWDEFNELERRSTSPSNAVNFMRGFAFIDVAEAAQRVTCPTLVVHVRGDLMPPLEQGRLLASLIPGARFVSLQGNNHILLDGEPAWPRFLEEMDQFLATID